MAELSSGQIVVWLNYTLVGLFLAELTYGWLDSGPVSDLNKAVYTALVAPSRPRKKTGYRRTDHPSDGRTDTPSYRVTSSRLKIYRGPGLGAWASGDKRTTSGFLKKTNVYCFWPNIFRADFVFPLKRFNKGSQENVVFSSSLVWTV